MEPEPEAILILALEEEVNDLRMESNSWRDLFFQARALLSQLQHDIDQFLQEE